MYPFYLFRGCHRAEGAHQLADVRLSEQLVLNYIAKAAVLCFLKQKQGHHTAQAR